MLTGFLFVDYTYVFTGPAVFIYGYAGPSFGSYEVQIDSTSTVLTAYAANNASTPYLLFGANNLTYGFHQLVLRNLGAKNGDAGGNEMLFDFIQTTVQLAPAGCVLYRLLRLLFYFIGVHTGLQYRIQRTKRPTLPSRIPERGVQISLQISAAAVPHSQTRTMPPCLCLSTVYASGYLFRDSCSYRLCRLRYIRVG